ncbi:hypothetical protein SAMD00019534_093700 [Acytostelium subglobosum LB1]|uniref:hypothetical protein n=1 Tax=Acytostelium subglobosum LB1 TaxID=1410327 RepID=UPI000645087E|nr:hypothetical protein SAMD00019534_093700 [Acytostelium subglobosum LB1]GAM26195.1 hypothetical protein SAMD00019534_093700 [Acytostelium subglobosum LB1]|eukprot:XP_012750749.1 hypothetical protein SAMD00019534_093700 [Acytostelium subglobosum LB1]
MDSIEKDLTNLVLDGDESVDQHQRLMETLREKKFQMLLRRDPTRVVILENIEMDTSQSVQTMIEQYIRNESMPSLVLVRYITMMRSMIMVFVHRDDAKLCKLLLERQPLIDLQDVIIYFGKDLSDELIKKHQLLPPFPQRQYLISPPLSPPEDWAAPGDGLEQPPPEHPDESHFSGFDPKKLTEKLQVIYQDNTSNGFPSITLEFCT